MSQGPPSPTEISREEWSRAGSCGERRTDPCGPAALHTSASKRFRRAVVPRSRMRIGSTDISVKPHDIRSLLGTRAQTFSENISRRRLLRNRRPLGLVHLLGYRQPPLRPNSTAALTLADFRQRLFDLARGNLHYPTAFPNTSTGRKSPMGIPAAYLPAQASLLESLYTRSGVRSVGNTDAIMFLRRGCTRRQYHALPGAWSTPIHAQHAAVRRSTFAAVPQQLSGRPAHPSWRHGPHMPASAGSAFDSSGSERTSSAGIMSWRRASSDRCGPCHWRRRDQPAVHTTL